MPDEFSTRLGGGKANLQKMVFLLKNHLIKWSKKLEHPDANLLILRLLEQLLIFHAKKIYLLGHPYNDQKCKIIFSFGEQNVNKQKPREN